MPSLARLWVTEAKLDSKLADSKARKALPGALLLLSSALLCLQEEESRSDHQASAGKDFLIV